MLHSVRRAALLALLSTLLTFCPLPALGTGQTQSLDELLKSASTAQSAENYKAAADFYARATTLSPNTPELWSNRGVMEFLAGQMDASMTSLKHALQLNSKLLAPMVFLGKAYLQNSKPAQALPFLDHAHTLAPDDIEVLLALGKANLDLNLQRQSAALFADATRAAPGDARAWLGLGSVSLQVIAADGHDLATAGPKSIWAQALYADELLAQGRPLEAQDLYKVALTEATPAQKSTLARTVEWMQSRPELFPFPTNSKVALDSLSAQLKSEADEAGLPKCDAATPREQPAGETASEAACAYWEGDYERSVAKSSQALKQSPHSAEALYWSIKANERLAVVALSRFEELAPTSSYVLVGDLYRDQRQPDDALLEYRKALAVDAQDSAALMGAAAAYLTRNQLDDAFKMAQAALAERPLDPQLNLLMAEILAAQNDYAQARRFLAKSTAAPPELQPRIHYLLGRAEAEDGNTAAAIRQLELALPGDKDGATHYQLMRLYKKSGNLAQAKKMEAGAKALSQKRLANAAIVIREATTTTP